VNKFFFFPVRIGLKKIDKSLRKSGTGCCVFLLLEINRKKIWRRFSEKFLSL